jgi:signal peptidase I
MHFDFELVLVLATVITGVCAALQRWRHRRLGPDEEPPSDPGGLLEFLRPLFPVVLVVLIIRSFIAEPFRIPSESMVPTLLQGDFVLVNKAAYGLHLPVLHTEILDTGEPERGDVAVFRYPPDPSTDYIKRIVGLPGDRIRYTANDQLYINGEPAAQEILEGFEDQPLAELRSEALNGDEHRILVHDRGGFRDSIRLEVPAGEYFVLGDNRNRSRDSRYWGTVPASNLVGRAWLVWFHFDFADATFQWSRIGTMIK